MITGGTAGIGRVTARRLAEMGAEVIVVGRDQARGESAAADIRASSGNDKVTFVAADLSKQAEVQRLAEEARGRFPRLHVLINNAGALYGERRLSPEGIEVTLALNHVGYFLLSHLLLPLLQASAPARIVNVASEAHRRTRLRFDDLHGERGYRGLLAYKRSKLANLLFTYELARRIEGTGVTANALHPGFVATDIGISNGCIPRFLWPLLTSVAAIDVERGAETSVHLASSGDVEGVSGKYFIKCRPQRSSAASYEREAATRLWNVTARLCGIEVR